MATSRNRRGIAFTWTVLVLLVMIGIVGLSIDWGWITVDASKLQNAGDAAALAGAMNIKKAFHDGTMGSAYVAARSLSMANFAAGSPVDVCYDAGTNNPDLDVVVGRWFPGTPPYFEPLDLTSGDVPNAVKVMTRHVDGWAVNQPLGLHFGPIFLMPRANVQREAIAMNVGGGGAALVCLAPDKGGLEIQGGGKINVSMGPVKGEIWVDSFKRDGKGAVYPNVNGAPDPGKGWWIDCAALNTCGTADPSIVEWFGEGPNFLYPVLQKLPEPIPDPLWWVPTLNVAAMDPRHETPANMYGMVVKVDPTTGVPVRDPNTGAYIPATDSTGKTFNVAAASPITSSTVRDFGQLIGSRQTLTVTPGYYPGGFAQTSSGTDFKTIKMLPGVYAVGGGASNGDKSGLILTGGALDAQGVMIYVTNSKLDTTGNWGHVNISGSYEYIKLLEYQYLAGDPEYYQNYDYKNYDKAGMAIFQDRRNPMDAVVIGGDNNMTMDGTLYFHCTGTEAGTATAPAASVPGGAWDVLLEVGGSAGQTGIQMIVDRLLVHGDADVIVKYDGRNFQPSNIVYLVK